MTLEQLLDRQNELLSTAFAASRGLTDAEAAEFDELQRSIEAFRGAGDGSQPTPAAPTPPAPTPPAPEEPSQTGGSSRSEAELLTRERDRIEEIRGLCGEFDMDAAPFIRSGATLDNVRAAVLERMRQTQAPISAGVTTGEDEADKFRRAAADGMLIRAGMAPSEAAPGAREFVGFSLREMAIQCAKRDGLNVAKLERMNSASLYDHMRQFFTPESSFPAMLDNVVGKSVVEAYTHAEVAFDKFCSKGSLPDFKRYDNNYTSGPVAEFEEIAENGEIKADTFEMKKRPQRQLKSYGKQFTLTRKAFIDDDIGVVTKVPAKYAAATKKTINSQVFRLLMGSDPIYDGLSLFCSEHQNLIKTGTAITFEAVQSMLMALSSQTDEYGQAIVVRPAALLIPAGTEMDVYALFNSEKYPMGGNILANNPLYQYRDSIRIISDPTLNAFAGPGNPVPWFLIGSSIDAEFIEVDYLNGQETPNVRPAEVPGKLGFIWDFWLDWGVQAMDFRGAIKNPGVKLSLKAALA